MTTANAAATLPEVRTAPPANGKDLITDVTGTPAPRHDGKNLLIKIDVGPERGVVHCQEPEHVGTHKQRHVLFCANEDCWLIFTPTPVFTDDYLELKKDEKTPAYVSDNTQKAETRFVVRVRAEQTAKVAMMVKTPPEAKHGPVIVVP